MLHVDAGPVRSAGPVPRVAFTTVEEGNLALHVADDGPAVHRRRAAVASALRVDRVHYMDQVHSADVVVPARGTPPADRAPTADALVTDDDGAALAVMVADCVPVVLVGVPAGTGSGRTAPGAGRSGTVRAVAHAGRRGLLAGILPATVARMRTLEADLEITAWIGPAICGSCYEVPEEMAQQAEAEQPGIRAATAWGTPSLDLPGAAAVQLRAAGAAVVPSGICTLEDPRFYSYRRDNGCGRFAGLAWMGAAADADPAHTPDNTTGTTP
ncbi:peptidoglycan editing factor PgeF [Zhihengliuella alba]|uniref:Peptidoglycan editing factor PgeF n=1 Tax=Zhihengliuella alba TaxID=547018 RepID=A0ABP7CZ25_9MICC